MIVIIIIMIIIIIIKVMIVIIIIIVIMIIIIIIIIIKVIIMIIIILIMIVIIMIMMIMTIKCSSYLVCLKLPSLLKLTFVSTTKYFVSPFFALNFIGASLTVRPLVIFRTISRRHPCSPGIKNFKKIKNEINNM